MKKSHRLIPALCVLLALAMARIAHAQSGAHVDILTIDGTIDTWVSGYVSRGIALAEQDGAQAAIIVLDTPGGALGAMQDITNRMLNARVPVVVYVSPQGAWAASAGTFITMAGNVAAMAPNTSIGAAHPVDSGGQNIASDERDKITNFSVSIIQNIAKARGRNADWAADAVRNSKSATAQEAVDVKAVDFIATDLNDLLNKLDGKTTKTAAGDLTLHTLRAGITPVDMNPAEIFLHTLVNPDVALFLMSIGLLAIVLEIYNPGATFPAVTGGICLVLASVALGQLPVNWGGVILIVLSVIVFAVDVKLNSFVLTGGGFIMFILGAILLFSPLTPAAPTMPDISVSPWLIVGLGLALAGIFTFLLGAAVRGKKYPVVSGVQALIGMTGTALSELNPNGTVRVRGEEWTASTQGDIISKGDRVRVVQVEGLSLIVTKPKPDQEPIS